MKLCSVLDGRPMMTGDGDVEGYDIPEELAGLPASAFAIVDGAVIDVRAITQWHVTPEGIMALDAAEDRQPIEARFDDVLTFDGKSWSVLKPG